MFSVRVPSKTFILGEYVVLDGGPGLVLTTPPDFTMTIHRSTQINPVKPPPFHPDSAAGSWLSQQREFFEQTVFDFFDPHQGQGGLGASSAEFIGLYAAQYPLEKTITSIEILLTRYWSVFPPKTAILPSGADIVVQALTAQSVKESTHGNSRPLLKLPLLNSGKAQFERAPEFTWVNEDASENCNAASIQKREFQQRSIVYWHRNQSQWNQLIWPFKELSYCLIRTGYKHPTHQSLKKLSSTALNAMSQLVEQGYAAFVANDALALIESVKTYAQWMKKEACVLNTTQTLLDCLWQSQCIVAAKGCGAFGADVVLVLLPTEKLLLFLSWLADKKLTIVAYR